MESTIASELPQLGALSIAFFASKSIQRNEHRCENFTVSIEQEAFSLGFDLVDLVFFDFVVCCCAGAFACCLPPEPCFAADPTGAPPALSPPFCEPSAFRRRNSDHAYARELVDVTRTGVMLDSACRLVVRLPNRG